ADPVRIEVMAAGTGGQWHRLTGALGNCEEVMQMHRIDVEEGARIYRACRSLGETIRSLNDCLIAAIAIRNDVPVLHRDRDYDSIARHFPLRVVTE
ncbi:MAG: PIN domain-containing protein, partial [Trebonia sp.]